jgi:IS30 family transposase
MSCAEVSQRRLTPARNAGTAAPAELKRSLTWDQRDGPTARIYAHHGHPGLLLRLASPWQRGSNENTNGLLWQYFALLAVHASDHVLRRSLESAPSAIAAARSTRRRAAGA